MKKIFIVLFSLLVPLLVFGQEETEEVSGPWTYDGMASLSFAQVSLTNWAQGGESSYAINALSAFNLNYAKDNTSWANSLDFGYGFQKIGDVIYNGRIILDNQHSNMRRHGLPPGPV